MKSKASTLLVALVLALLGCGGGTKGDSGGAEKPNDSPAENRTGVVEDKRYDPPVVKSTRKCAAYTTNKKGMRTCARYDTQKTTTDDADWVLVIKWSDGTTGEVDVEKAEYDKYSKGQAYP